MNPSLFGLISRAGELSLDELRARSAVGEAALAHHIAAMLGEGVVELTADRGSPAETGGPEARQSGQHRLIGRLRGQDVAAIETALQSAFIDGGEAEAVVIRPTTRGFRVMS